MATRPRELPGGAWVVENSQVAKDIATALVDSEDKSYYFKSMIELNDVFGLAFKKEDTKEAIDKLITFLKWAKSQRCHVRNIGLKTIDLEKQIFAFTYTFESFRYENQPLLVDEAFKLEFPLLMMANHMAEFWISAYNRRPLAELLKVANGK